MVDLSNAEKILQIAMELEETGKVFYEVAAAGCTKSRQDDVSELFHHLAKEEDDHYKIFQRMLEELAERTQRQPVPLTDEQRKYVQDLINERIIPNPAATLEKVRHCSLAEALDIGIEMERESVAFYTGILLTVTNGQDTEIVQRIIDEEKQHESDLLDSRRHVTE